MKQYYHLLKPIQGVQIRGATSQIVLLPAGTAIEWVCRPRRWPNVAEVHYNGAITILFFDDFYRRSKIRKVEGRARGLVIHPVL